MPAVGQDARLLSNDVLAKWLIEDFPFRIQLAPVFPFDPVSGDQLRYSSTGKLAPAQSIGFGGSIADGTQPAIDPNRTYSFAELATQFQITYKAQDFFSSNSNDQAAVQMAVAIRRLLYRFWLTFEQGDAANEGEFDGLLKLVDPSQVIDLKCQPVTLEVLQQAKDLVRTSDGRNVVVYTGSPAKQAILTAHWSRGVMPQYAELSFPSPSGGRRRQQILHFDGAPVHVCDLNQVVDCQASESGVASHIWFFVLGANNLHGITPASLGSSMFVTRSTIQPDGSTVVYHVTMPVGIALGSKASLSVIKNVRIAAAA